MKTRILAQLAALAAVTLLAILPAAGQIITTDPGLPPIVPSVGTSGYGSVGTTPVFNLPASVIITVDSLFVRPLLVSSRNPVGPDELANFDVNFDISGSATSSGIGIGLLDSSGTGSANMVSHGKIGNTTGTFAAEMLSLNLSGTSILGSYMIRESPSLASLGTNTITDIGGGLYRIDSFFDVFTELSLDGGATWSPNANGPTHLVLTPEPADAVLVSASLCALALLGRRRRRGSRF